MTRGWLGVGIQDLDDQLAESFGVKAHSGVLVSQVFDGGPADGAGLKPGDIIRSLNGKEMHRARDLTRAVAGLAPDTTADLIVRRDGEPLSFEVKLGEREAGESSISHSGGATRGDLLGLELEPSTPSIARSLGVDEGTRGLVVRRIGPDSPAAGYLQTGDVIIEVNRKTVRSVDDMREALAGRDDATLLLRVQRRGARLFLTIRRQ